MRRRRFSKRPRRCKAAEAGSVWTCIGCILFGFLFLVWIYCMGLWSKFKLMCWVHLYSLIFFLCPCEQLGPSCKKPALDALQNPDKKLIHSFIDLMAQLAAPTVHLLVHAHLVVFQGVTTTFGWSQCPHRAAQINLKGFCFQLILFNSLF